MRAALYYLARFLQLLGMSFLLGDVVMAGQMGPDPKLFGLGVVVFLIGWGITRLTR